MLTKTKKAMDKVFDCIPPVEVGLLVVLLGAILFLFIHTYKMGLEGSKIREQVTAWEAQAAAQSEPLSIQVATADPSSCKETIMQLAKRGLRIVIAGEPATMAKMAQACEGGEAQVTIQKDGN